MTRPRLADFTDAPLGSYVCEEGWLVIRDQAWTLEEWLRKGIYSGRAITYATERHRKDRERKRLYYAQRRAEGPAPQPAQRGAGGRFVRRSRQDGAA